MLDAIVWGLVQGLTEFLPISSSGHLALVPALLGAAGADIGDPDLAVSAVLHLGTLVAVVAYYRRDVISLVRSPLTPRNRTILTLLAIGTVPAIVGLPLLGFLEEVEGTPRLVGLILIGNAAVLFVGDRVQRRSRTIVDGTWRDALAIGLAQAAALLPGISRSGTTITTAIARGIRPAEAARFSFLLAVPAIAGGGLLSLLELEGSTADRTALLVGFLVSAVSGYVAIAGLLRLLVRRGFRPFVVYCVVVGTISVIVL